MTRAAAGRRVQSEHAVAEREPAYHSLYEEYVRGFEDIPVLEDAVRIPSRPPTPPSFVRGERRSLRKEERSDGYLLREAHVAELELHYQEYVAPERATAAPKRRSRRKNKKRGPRRSTTQ
jgi:hypothetical protein